MYTLTLDVPKNSIIYFTDETYIKGPLSICQY